MAISYFLVGAALSKCGSELHTSLQTVLHGGRSFGPGATGSQNVESPRILAATVNEKSCRASN